jgi:hypothetical protein
MTTDPGIKTERHCVHCGSANVNACKSWNIAGEWICDDCCPDTEQEQQQ